MGFWSKLGKIAAIGGAGAATYFTGGAASPWLAAAIGAGTGAASGAASGGGWKGALAGAGIGAATGGLASGAGGAAGGAAGRSLGGAASSILKNPNTYKGIANAVLQPDGTPTPSRTGGLLNTVGNVGDVMSGLEAGRAGGREAAAIANQNQARAAADIFRTRMDASLKGPELSARQTALGDTMANIQPFQWTGETKMVGNIPVPQATGGLTPANFGPATRQAGADLARVAGSRVTSPVFNLPEVPVLPDLPQAGKLDSILSTVGPIASIAGRLGDAFLKPGTPRSGGVTGTNERSFLDDPNTFVGPTQPGDLRNPDTFVGPVRPPEDVTAGVDPSQLPGGVEDPWEAYLRWLADNDQGGY